MRDINLLDQQTIDKIAAGEVVERPASVVKELVENSIDAGAKDITVEIRDGGLTYIRITDNGSGIPEDQIEKAFLRHSTSKITDAKDLMGVRSLGFRGEALSSIAAVSKVEVLTKTADSFVGTSYRIEGGREIEKVQLGTPNGTTMLVRMLFFNTPARRKFLKSPMTEGNYVSNIVERLALSHPDISFRFLNNTREQLKTPGSGKLTDAIYEIYGKETAKGILEIEHADEKFKISGWIGKPSVGRGNRMGESFFVDGRYVKSKIISKALEEGYHGYLMQHRFPFAVLLFDFDEASVDVNVHPTKQEVRFFNEQEVFEAVKSAVKERLGRREDIEEVSPVSEAKPKISEQKTEETRGAEPFEKNRLEEVKAKIAEDIQKDSPYSKQYEYRAPEPAIVRESSFLQSDSAPEKTEAKMTAPQITEPEKTEAGNEMSREASAPITMGPVVEGPVHQESFLSREAKASHRIIGQVFLVYWLVEYDGSLYIIDQHAAHEKVLYERFMKSMRSNEMSSQQISPPMIVSLNKIEQSALEENREVIENTGYAFEPFGGNEYMISAVPSNVVDVDIKQLFLSIVSDLASGKREADMNIVSERIATMSCKAAVKEHDRMSVEEADALIEELLNLDEPYHCPHGRPTIISMTKNKLDKLFRRIV